MMPCVIPWPKAGRDIRTAINTAATIRFELLKLVVSTALLPSLGLSASGGSIDMIQSMTANVTLKAQRIWPKICMAKTVQCGAGPHYEAPGWCSVALFEHDRNRKEQEPRLRPYVPAGIQIKPYGDFLNRLLASVRIAVSSNRQFVPARETNVTTACRADWATIHSIGGRRDLLRRTKNKSKRLRQGGVHSKLGCRGVPGESGVPIERNRAAPRRAT